MNPSFSCDRRHFLKVGTLGIGGPLLPAMLRAETTR